jgi:hypothetical protein
VVAGTANSGEHVHDCDGRGGHMCSAMAGERREWRSERVRAAVATRRHPTGVDGVWPPRGDRGLSTVLARARHAEAGAGRAGFAERAEREGAAQEEKETLFLFIFQSKFS